MDIEPGAPLADTWQVWVEVDDPRFTPLVRVVHAHDPGLEHLLAAHVGRPIEVIPKSDHPRLGRQRDWIHADALHPRTCDPTQPAVAPARIPARITEAVVDQYVRPVVDVMTGRQPPEAVLSLLDPRLRCRYPSRLRPVAQAHEPPHISAHMQASYPRLDIAAAVTVHHVTHPLAMGMHTAKGELYIDTVIHHGLNLTVRTKPSPSAVRAPAVSQLPHTSGQRRTRT